ncbi:MAG: hypothetical protein J6A20_09120 [Muribaculaceae bacterium]|nr:hypothetical protein [Muribaculaceae bacterium]
MTRHIYLLVIMLLGVVMTGCGNDDEFVINCRIKDLGDKGVEMVYFNRGLQRVSFHPDDGKVTLRGSSPDLTPVEVFTLDNRLLFTCVAKNGDELEVKLDPSKVGAITIEGNDISEQYAKFISTNAETLVNTRDAAGINALITKEVTAHPDRISSALILMTMFHAPGYEMLADSLIHILVPEARPSALMKSFAALVGEQVSTSARGNVRGMTFHTGRDTVNGHDTIVRFMPTFHSYGLLVFVSDRKSDTITNRLNELIKDYHRRRLEIMELSFQSDSATWRRSIRIDSAKWTQAWVPGGNAASQIRNLAVPTTPFFIVTDSLGKQLYRGRSIASAVDTLRYRLKEHLISDSVAAASDSILPPDNSDRPKLEPVKRPQNQKLKPAKVQ